MNSEPKKFFIMLTGILLVGRTLVSIAEIQRTVDDPVHDFVDGGGVSKDDQILVVRLDWNEDGRGDLLVSSNRQMELGGREGGNWNVWLANNSGAYDLIGSIAVPEGEGFYVGRFAETGLKVSIVKWSALGGTEASLLAFYLGGNQTIESTVLGGAGGRIALEEQERTQRLFDSTKLIPRIVTPAGELWPENGPKVSPPEPLVREENIPYFLVHDPLDESRYLVYSKATGKLIGYEIDQRVVALEDAAKLGLPTERDVVTERRAMEERPARKENENPSLRWFVVVGFVVVAVGLGTGYVIRRRKSLSRVKEATLPDTGIEDLN